MKRNLFAVFLAVMLVAALMLVVAPSAKAEEGNTIIANEDGEKITVSQEGKTLDLQGKKNVVVKFESNVTLSVIDTGNTELDASTAGSLTVEGEGVIAPVTFDGNYRYLAVEENGTYSFHPFNLTISAVGLNTIGEDISLRATFYANNVAKAKATEWGIEKLTGDTTGQFSAVDYYSFGNNNLFHAYMNLDGSLANEMLDVENEFRAYIVINGQTVVSSHIAKVTPREVLKGINNAETVAKATDAQKAAIKTMAATYAHLADLFTSVTGDSCTHYAMADATCVNPSTCKNCDVHTEGTVDLLHGHSVTADDRFCRDCNGIEGIDDRSNVTLVTLPGKSNSWEISGQVVRPLNDDDGWNFGFEIESGDKKLVFTAVTAGIVFEASDDHGRYAYHAFTTSQYNLNSDVAAYMSVKGNTKDTMYFRAMIVNDVFYAWFWFDDANGEPVLSWFIPLTETLIGNPNSDVKVWNDNPFPGFDVGSEYNVSIRVNSTNGSGSFTNMDIKTGDSVDKTQVPEIVYTLQDATVDASTGAVNSVPGKLMNIAFAGSSATWELSGTVDRLDDKDNLNFGFEIESGDKKLRVSAVNSGPRFEILDATYGYAEYGYHAWGESQYNFNAGVSQFLNRAGQNKIHFKAMIANDMFYAWFWYDGEQPTLSWVIPLTEALTGRPGYDVWNSPFTGFAAGSRYTMNFYIKSTSAAGSASNLSVKTGFEAPKFIANTIDKATVDMTAGVINNIPNAGVPSEVLLYGSNSTWEITGAVERLTDVNNLNFGFMLQAGGKSLRMSAVTSGIVFEGPESGHSGHGRYAYHAFQASQYNLNTNINEFVAAKTKNKIYFKAMIVKDVFYVWYWYENQAPTLSWYVPLTETLIGNSNADLKVWSDNPFTGFEAGSSYSVSLFTNNTSASGRFVDLTVNTGASVDTAQVPENVSIITNANVDAATGAINSIAGSGSPMNVAFAGNSATWEMSGTVNRLDDKDNLNFGFEIRCGDKKLRISAVNSGPRFEILGSGYTYAEYGYHAWGESQYNYNAGVSQFLNRAGQNKIHFKAIIANDIFYVWFWYDGEDAKLSWEIPLTETLTGRSGNDAWSTPFTGFAAGSSYTMDFYIKATAAAGSVSELSVKTGANVDTSIIPVEDATTETIS